MSAFVFLGEFFICADELVALLFDSGDGFDAMGFEIHDTFGAAVTDTDGARFEINVENLQVFEALALAELDLEVGSIGLMADEKDFVGAAQFGHAGEFILKGEQAGPGVRSRFYGTRFTGERQGGVRDQNEERCFQHSLKGRPLFGGGVPHPR